MSAFLLAAAMFVLLNAVLGAIRLYASPYAADRMLGILIFGSTTVAALLLLAYRADPPVLVEVALCFVLLAAIGSIAFVQQHLRMPQREP